MVVMDVAPVMALKVSEDLKVQKACGMSVVNGMAVEQVTLGACLVLVASPVVVQVTQVAAPEQLALAHIAIHSTVAAVVLAYPVEGSVVLRFPQCSLKKCFLNDCF